MTQPVVLGNFDEPVGLKEYVPRPLAVRAEFALRTRANVGTGFGV